MLHDEHAHVKSRHIMPQAGGLRSWCIAQHRAIASNSDCALLAPSDMASFVDSLVAPLSLINVLLAELGNRNKDRISDNFVKLERIWDDYGIYDKGESASEVKHEF